MIDFSKCKRINKDIIAGESKKEWILYDGKTYLLKYPSLYKSYKDNTYFNQCFSEYISCHIFNLLGVKAQNTLIGINNNLKNNIVVACEDITQNGQYKLYRFSDIADNNIEPINNSIKGIYNIINSQDKIDKDILLNFFWDMFVVDAFVNNIDRDIKNIGILYDFIANIYLPAPVYDLGRSLYDYIKLDSINRINSGDSLLLKEKMNIGSFSVLRSEGSEHINFLKFFSESKDIYFEKAKNRIRSRIDINKINEIIDNTPFLTEDLNKFYKLILLERFKILFG